MESNGVTPLLFFLPNFMNLIIIIFLLIFLALAVMQDIRSFRISNIVIVIGAATGLALNIMIPVESGAAGGLNSLYGLCAGLVLFLPFYILKIMGAGDAKLMAMVGAYSGWQDILLIILYILICGGVLSLIVAGYRNKFRYLFNAVQVFFMEILLNQKNSSADKISLTNQNIFHINTTNPTIRLPYSIAIAAGMVIYLLMSDQFTS